MLILALALQAAAPQSGPIYLKCALASDPAPMDVQINEASNTVTYSFVLGGLQRTYTKPAGFTSDRVTFNGFTISRVDLSFYRDNSWLAGITSRPVVERGQCQRSTLARAF